ncbi:MAG: site-2 protease family protein [Alphaproteobacteria bacterium]
MMVPDGLPEWLYQASTWVVPVILAVTLHEAAHGFVAWRLGDDTAWRLGRVSANPFRHVDLMGTILLPALLVLTHAPFLFGWAKPVPVAFHRLRRPRRDMVLVAAAGPGINLLLALASALLMKLPLMMPIWLARWLAENLGHSILMNLALAAFNLLPMPPLDGGRMAVGLLPIGLSRPLARLENTGMLILIGVMVLLPMVGDRIGVNLDLMTMILRPMVDFLGRLVFWTAGLM